MCEKRGLSLRRKDLRAHITRSTTQIGTGGFLVLAEMQDHHFIFVEYEQVCLDTWRTGESRA